MTYIIEQKKSCIDFPLNTEKRDQILLKITMEKTKFEIKNRNKDYFMKSSLDFLELSSILHFSRLVTNRSPVYVVHLHPKNIKLEFYLEGIINQTLYAKKFEKKAEKKISYFDRPKILFKALPKETKVEIDKIGVILHSIYDKKINYDCEKLMISIGSQNEKEINIGSNIKNTNIFLEKSEIIHCDLIQLNGKLDWTKHKEKTQIGPDLCPDFLIQGVRFSPSEELIHFGINQFKHVQSRIKERDSKIPQEKIENVKVIDVKNPLIDQIHIFGNIEIQSVETNLFYHQKCILGFHVKQAMLNVKQSLDSNSSRYFSNLTFNQIGLFFTQEIIPGENYLEYQKNLFIDKSAISSEFDGKDMIDDISVFLTVSSVSIGYSRFHQNSLISFVEFIKEMKGNNIQKKDQNPQNLSSFPRILLKVDIGKFLFFVKDHDSILLLKTSLDCLWNIPSFNATLISEKMIGNFICQYPNGESNNCLIDIGKISLKGEGEKALDYAKLSNERINISIPSSSIIMIQKMFQTLLIDLIKEFSSSEIKKSNDINFDNIGKFILDLGIIEIESQFTPNVKIQASISSLFSNNLMELISIKGLKVAIQGEEFCTLEEIKFLPFQHPSKKSKSFNYFHNIFSEQGADLIEEIQNVHTIEIYKPLISFRHDTNLGEYFDQISLAAKALEKEFSDGNKKNTSDIILPRIMLRLFDGRVEFQDNPIDKALAIHLQTWPQEYIQREERNELLESKLKELNLSYKESEKMRRELLNQNSKIYMNRFTYFIKNNTRPRGLFTIDFGSADIDIYQKDILKKREGVISMIKEYDPTPIPTDSQGNDLFSMVFGLSPSINVKKVSLSIRNFPLPFIKVDEATINGNVLFSQKIESEENSILRKITLGHGMDYELPFTILPIYRYYCGKINVSGVEITVGTNFDPAFADLNVLTTRLSPHDLDPSKPNNWWDTMRRIAHGNYEVTVRDARIRLLYNVNCYDVTDHIDAKIDFIHGNGSKGKYLIHLDNLVAQQKPNFSMFSSIVEFPYVDITLEYKWKCDGDPFNHYFDIVLPKEFRTENGIKEYKDKVQYDSFKIWRSTEVDCIFKANIGKEKSRLYTSPTVMFDPLSTSSFMKFVKFFDNEALQIYLGKIVKFGLPLRRQYDVMDYIRSFQIQMTSESQHIIWSNGVEDNNLLDIHFGNFKFYGYLYRENLPDLKINKRKRKKIELTPAFLNANVKNIEVSVHSYDKDDNEKKYQEKFGKNFFVSVGEVSFVGITKRQTNNEEIINGNEPFIIKEIKPGYENQLKVSDVKCLWNPSLRDAILVWVDVIQQFAFNELEILQRLTLKKIEETKLKSEEEEKRRIEKMIQEDNDILNYLLSNEKKQEKIDPKLSNQKVDDFFYVILERIQGILDAEETEEGMIFRAEKGLVEIRSIAEKTETNIITSKEILCLLERMEGYIVQTSNLPIDNTWIDFSKKNQNNTKVMEHGDWVISVNIVDNPPKGKPFNTLNIDVPEMKLNFGSTHLQTLIDVITNSMIPKKLVRTVTLQDRFSTILYKTKLDPESWGNIGELMKKCEECRKEVRSLESKLSAAQREASKQMTDKIIETMGNLEERLNEQKALYHGMKETLNKNVNNVLLKKQDERVVDMIINITVHSLTYNMLDKNDDAFVEILFTLFKGTIIKNKDYSILHNFTLHHVAAKNKLPNPIYQEMLMPYNEENDVNEENDYMLRVCANKKPPIGGIGGFDHLEIDLAPLHLQITYDMYRALWDYCFPLSKQEKHEKEILSSSITPNTATQLKSQDRKSILPTETEKRTILNKSDADIDEMKQRAKHTKIFNYVRMQEVQLYISFMGVPEDQSKLTKYVRNFEKLSVHIQPITYNQQVWSWQDFAESLKKDVINQILSFILPETVKSLTMNRLTGVFEIFKPLLNPNSSNPKKDETPQGDKMIKSNKKIKQEIINLQSQLKEGEFIEENKLKQFMLFGKSVAKEDVGKKMFGSNYSFSVPTETEKSNEVQDDITNIFDTIKKEKEKE